MTGDASTGRVLVVGRYTADGGLDVALHAACLLQWVHRRSMRLVLAGPIVDRTFRDAIEVRRASLRLRDVDLIDRVPTLGDEQSPWTTVLCADGDARTTDQAIELAARAGGVLILAGHDRGRSTRVQALVTGRNSGAALVAEALVEVHGDGPTRRALLGQPAVPTSHEPS